MSEVATAAAAPRSRAAGVALAIAAASLALDLTASFADLDDLYLPGMVLGVLAIGLGIRARRTSERRVATAAVVVGAWAPGTTLVYLVVIGLQQLF